MKVNIEKTLERIVEKLNNSTGISVNKAKFNEKVGTEKERFLTEVCEFLGIEVVYVRYFITHYLDVEKRFEEGTETPHLVQKDDDEKYLYLGRCSDPIEREKVQEKENWIEVPTEIELHDHENLFTYPNGEVWILKREDIHSPWEKVKQIA